MTAVHHPLFARFYSHVVETAAGEQQQEHRREMLDGLSGRVIEVGAGDGANFALYPATVSRVLALEPEPYMRRMALRRAAGSPVPVDVVDGVAEHLPVPDGSCDAVVASLMLCSVANQAEALAEMHRVLREGGELRFYEHVVSRRPRAAVLERIADATLWPHLFGGCHTSRDTLSAIRAAGFRIETVRRFPFGFLAHALGRARRV